MKKNIPLFLPKIFIDGFNVKGWEFTIRLFSFSGRKSYIIYRYENPDNKKEYIFHSKSLKELINYLSEFQSFLKSN